MNFDKQRLAIIQVEAITKVYQMGNEQVHALGGVSLTVPEGEYVLLQLVDTGIGIPVG